MPRNWEPMTIPVGAAGEDAGSDPTALRPPALALAENWVMSHEGALNTRPAWSEVSNSFWLANVNGVPNGTAGSYVAADDLPFARRSIAGVRTPGEETPMALFDGRAFIREGSEDWHDLGAFWSARTRRLGFTRPAAAPSQIFSAGAVENGLGSYYLTTEFTVHSADGQALGFFVPTVAPVANTMICPVALGDATGLVWNTGAGTLRLLYAAATDPHVRSDVQLATDARTTFGPHQWGVWDAATSRLFVAYLTTTANQVKILSVNTSGTVTGTATFNHGTNIESVSLALVDGVLALALGEDGDNDVFTKIYSTAATPVDQALDVTIGLTGGGDGRYVAIGPGATNTAVLLAADGTTNTLDIVPRSTTAATSGTRRTLFGSSSGIDALWYPRWAPWRQTSNGKTRVLAGIILESGSGNDITSTWYVLDVTSPSLDFEQSAPLVAVGPITGSDINWAAPADMRGLSLPLLSSADHITFDATGGVSSAPLVMRLEFDGQVPVAEAAGAWLLGGSVTHHYDGQTLTEASFLQVPEISATAAGGGTLAAGSYALQAVYRWTDALGKVHRSSPSNVVSVTVGASGSIDVSVTSLQMTKRVSGVRIEIYMSVINPPASGVFPLYLTSLSGGGLANPVNAASAAVNIAGAVSTAAEILYTDGGVLANFPPPGSDGGLASVGVRTWAASGHVLSASKLLDRGQAPAWAEDLQVQIPATGGDIRALLPAGESVLVFCERAIYVVGGAGFDDTLQGPGFSEPSIVSDVGATGARAVAAFPGGALFQTPERHIYALSGSSVQRISRPVDVQDALGPPLGIGLVHMAHWPSHESVVVTQEESSGVLLWNYRNGQWLHWQLRNIDEDAMPIIASAVVDGYPWGLTEDNTGPRLGRWDQEDYQDGWSDGGVNIEMRLITPWIRTDGDRARGWARVGRASLHGRVQDAPVSVVMFVDRDQVQLASLSRERHDFAIALTPGTPATTWPRERMAPEVCLATQKCSQVRLELFFFGGRVALAEMELGIRRAGPAAPPGQRVA